AFPWPQLRDELRTLVKAARWHIAGRQSAGASVQAEAAEVRAFVDDVDELVGKYRRALEYAVDCNVPGAAPVAGAFLAPGVHAGGYVGAQAWVTHMVRHFDQSGARSF